MRVGFLTSWNERCGIAEYSRHLVRALREQPEVSALEVVLASFRPSPKPVYAAMGKALSGGDVAHVQHSYAFFGGMNPVRAGWAPLADSVTRPLVVTLHELDLRPTGAYRLPPSLELAYKRRFNRGVFLHLAVGRWIVHAAALRDGLLELGAPEGCVTYRPLPLSPAPDPPSTVEVSKRFDLHGKRPLVILGFLARRKGYELALESLRSLPPEFVLVAAGGEHAADRTGTEAWIHAEAERLGVADRLRITGYLPEPELEAVTAAAELVLAPFREMSASASLNFALARGRPVVAADLPEIRALDCVRHFPAGDPAALAEAVREVSGATTLRRELSERAASYLAAHSYEALAEETVRIYAELLAERSHARRA